MNAEHEDASHQPRPTRFGRWILEGIRSTFFLAPRWDGLMATPASVLGLILLEVVASLVIERGYIEGDASFYAPGLLGGWLLTVVAAGAAWWACASDEESSRVPASTLFALLVAQGIALTLMLGPLFIALMRAGWYAPQQLGYVSQWLLWLAPLCWSAGAAGLLIWRGGSSTRQRRLAAGLALAACIVVVQAFDPPRHWYPDYRESTADAGDRPWRPTPGELERQHGLLDERLRALPAGRPGVVDLYVITFAPDDSAEVFRREGAMVAEVMTSRFGTADRAVQLANHPRSVGELPWATPANLERAIRHIATLMNDGEDLLFVHMSAHGAKSGRLSASLWPLEMPAVEPEMVRGWLNDAGVNARVISVSACYSGSWIAPLSDDRTVVVTAADAEHTSLGCGRKSELTYFGRAMYDELIRSGAPFEAAHARAREVIRDRENEAGKKDGYSNPQIHLGARALRVLSMLEAGLPAPK